jgi:hypothetical protein
MFNWAGGIIRRPKALSAESDASATAPYLLSGAPAFDISISEFREKFKR